MTDESSGRKKGNLVTVFCEACLAPLVTLQRREPLTPTLSPQSRGEGEGWMGLQVKRLICRIVGSIRAVSHRK